MPGSTCSQQAARTLGSMTKRSKVELYEQIRKSSERDGLSIRALAERFEVHRRTVRARLGQRHEWVKRQARRADLHFCELSNGFASWSDPPRP